MAMVLVLSLNKKLGLSMDSILQIPMMDSIVSFLANIMNLVVSQSYLGSWTVPIMKAPNRTCGAQKVILRRTVWSAGKVNTRSIPASLCWAL